MDRPARALPMFPARLEEPCDLLASHAQAGPRYTSYPPATQFRGTFGADAARAQLAAIPAGEPLSLYAHIPFCPQLCWYCGCNVQATRDRSKGTGYVDRLIKELALVAAHIPGPRPVVELALGGGSPNFLKVDDARRLLAAVREHFAVDQTAELGVELDPRETHAEQIDAFADLGFTRVSVGVQDFDPEVQANIHREQSVAQTRAVIERARERGFRSVNVDLVYGLPGQTPEKVARTIDAVIAMAPDRLAVFGYAHLPHLRPHQKLVERHDPVPGIEARIELLRVIMAHLADAGYVRIGLDHFARPGDPLVVAAEEHRLARNFQGYVVGRAHRLLGVGASSISDSGGAYWQDEVDADAWAAAIDRGELPVVRGVRLDADDVLRRDVIMRLMCEGRLSFGEIEAAHAIRFEDTFARELTTLAERHDALVRIDRDARALVATPLGHHFIRNLCAVFDRYAATTPGGSPTI